MARADSCGEWGASYRYNSLPEETFQANNLNFKILFGLNTEGGILTPVTLSPKAYLEISSNEPKSVIVWWDEIIRPLRDLFSLALDRPIDITNFSIFDEREKANTKEHKVYSKGRKTLDNDKELIAEDMLFAKKDIENGDIGSLIDKWFTISKLLPMVCNLYSSAKSIREQYIEEEFLSLAQAIEVYHRSRFNSAILPTNAWKDKVNKFIDSVPCTDKKWLREKLAWSNSPTLQNRLDELLDALEPTTSLLVADKLKFTTSVKHTRNYFTHWDENARKKASSYPDLYFATTTLLYLLAACLLIELGFSSQKVSQLFSRNFLIHNFRLNSDNTISPKL